MEIEEYQKYTRTTAAKNQQSEREVILNWVIGLVGEAGDLAGCVKKTVFHDNPQLLGTRENIGDCLWYLSEIANFYGWHLTEIMEENKVKLNKRIAENRASGRENFGAERKGERIDWNEKRSSLSESKTPSDQK